FIGGIVVGLAGLPTAWPAEPPSVRYRGLVVEAVRNPAPAFMVRVDVDRPDRTYQAGQLVQVKVISGKPGYLYLLYINADGALQCVFPNRFQKDNHIPDHQEILIPAPSSPFRFRVGPPFGREILKAVVSLKPLDPHLWGVKSLNDLDVTPLDPDQAKKVLDTLQQTPGEWAEHEVHLFTLSPDKLPQPLKSQRIAVLIGFGHYQDPAIRDLKVGDQDAKAMAQLLQRHGQFDKIFLLVNQEATLAALEKLISQTLPDSTRPGDLLLIFWSGHGGRCADDNGDEPDGLDEYLVPYDGRLGNLQQIRSSMLLDDLFGRWIQRLDGRRILLVLDTCYSAGQSAHEKGLRSPHPAPAPSAHFDFLDGELLRAKDVGQKETAMLAASKANQLAFIRREGDLSVMTYFLLRHLESASGPVTLQNAFQYLEKAVPAYVQQKFPGATQTPVLIDHTTTTIFLRP
ncbi:MAG TPA: caspase family protein, partial [Thermoguttaceae bacterium]|nr:caspase family protein [Thermoguttaceae bacterium]